MDALDINKTSEFFFSTTTRKEEEENKAIARDRNI
jgi:hypothetical protein